MKRYPRFTGYRIPPAIALLTVLASAAPGAAHPPVPAQPPTPPQQSTIAPSPAVGADHPTIYVGGALAVTNRPMGPPDYHYTELLGGVSPDLAGTFGVHATRRVSVGAEVSFGSLSGPVVFDHMAYYHSSATYRETLLSGFVRWHQQAGPIWIEPVGLVGVSFAHISLTEQVTGKPTSYPIPDEFYTNSSLAVGGGVDVLFPVGRSSGITASFRYIHVNRDQSVAYPGYVGIGNHTLQVGGGVRWWRR